MAALKNVIQMLVFSLIFILMVMPVGLFVRLFRDRHMIKIPVSRETYFNFRR